MSFNDQTGNTFSIIIKSNYVKNTVDKNICLTYAATIAAAVINSKFSVAVWLQCRFIDTFPLSLPVEAGCWCHTQEGNSANGGNSQKKLENKRIFDRLYNKMRSPVVTENDRVISSIRCIGGSGAI